MSRTGLVPSLTRHAEEPFIALNPADMRRYRLDDDALVKVRSRRGHVILPARASLDIQSGQAYMPMHWGSGFMAGDGVNALAGNARDPISHQPELKHSAVGIEAVKFPWQACAWVRGPISPWRGRLAKWLKVFPYAVILPTAVGGEGVRLRLAAKAADPALLAELIGDLNLEQADLAFDDPSRGLVRRIQRAAPGIGAFLLAGDTRAHEALLTWADSGIAPENVTQVLMGRGPATSRARIVCTCENVSDQAIMQAIAQGQDLAQLKETLKCGTGCGSCLPQLNQMLREASPSVAS
jgi:assimilatory nitrate reductase catalytic subunit